jgi:hypothetical protein
MKILILSILLRGPFFSDSLPNRADLFAALKSFHEETKTANVARLEVNNSTTWMHWMPSVGISFGQPTVGFSLGQIAANIESRKSRLAEKTQISRSASLAFKTDSFALVALLERNAMLRNSLTYLKLAESIENQKFEIEKEKWRKNEMSPPDWLNAQAANLRAGQPLNQRLEEIELLEIEVRKTAKY